MDVAKKEQIDGILTCGTDAMMMTVGYICDQMHLLGPSEEASIFATNKALMKDRFIQTGVRTAKYEKISSFSEAKSFSERYGFPVVLKIVDGCGGRGISIINTQEELHQSFSIIKSETKLDYLIIEEYISGEEFGAQAFVRDGELTFIMPHGDIVFHGSDEVIVPSYTFVSSALAFVRQGCKIILADSMTGTPNLDADNLEALINENTKVIVPVHYAGVACDMDKIMEIANRHNIFVVEDAAQAIDAYYKGRPLGTIGHLSAFSFHETKNIIAGEGGLLGINDERFIRRAEIIWEKGTNRSEFFRGEVNKYGWVDTGSSFLPSEVVSAFLWAQLESLEQIQSKRKQLWERYYAGLRSTSAGGHFRLPQIPDYATNNAHMFYIVCRSIEERTALIKFLKEHDVLSVFHYLSLHKSYYYVSHYKVIPDLPNCDMYADCLLRLPMFYELELEQVDGICELIREFFSHNI